MVADGIHHDFLGSFSLHRAHQSTNAALNLHLGFGGCHGIMPPEGKQKKEALFLVCQRTQNEAAMTSLEILSHSIRDKTWCEGLITACCTLPYNNLPPKNRSLSHLR